MVDWVWNKIGGIIHIFLQVILSVQSLNPVSKWSETKIRAQDFLYCRQPPRDFWSFFIVCHLLFGGAAPCRNISCWTFGSYIYEAMVSFIREFRRMQIFFKRNTCFTLISLLTILSNYINYDLLLVLVNTLMIGKPEKGKMVENMLLQMAQTGQLSGRIGEPELIRILENVNRQTSKTTTVKVRTTTLFPG